MRFSTHTQPSTPAALTVECQRLYSQAVATCLARLQRAADLLRQPLLSEAQSASLLCDLEAQTDRLNTLLRQALAAGTLGALASGEAPEQVALPGVLASLVSEYQALSPAHTFHLRLAAAPVTPAYALAGVLIVFQLLLDNAVRCTPAGESISIEGQAAADGSGWDFHIRDRGAGIAPRHLENLFDNPSLAAPAAVYGLGLSLARLVVEALGGRLWVESELDEGATFSFSLPRDVLPRRWPVSRPKVLVIEENTELRATLKAGFEEAGFEVQTAVSAAQGLSVVDDFAPNLVLLELAPASLAGQAALVSLRQCSDAAVIFLVAPGDRGSVADALWQGASDCLVKPFHIRELIARTRAILRRRPAPSLPDLRAAARPRAPLIHRPKINPLLQ